MKHRFVLHILLAVVPLAFMAGCSMKEGTSPEPQPRDTLYTEERAMADYANDPEQALQILDSAKAVGNLSAERAELLRATVYSRTLNTPCHDSAIVISERLLDSKPAKSPPHHRTPELFRMRKKFLQK